MHSSTMANKKSKEKGDKQQRTPSPTKKTPDSEFRGTANRQAQTRQETKVNLRSAFFIKEDNADQVRIVPSPSAKIKDSNIIAQDESRRKLSAGFRNGENRR